MFNDEQKNPTFLVFYRASLTEPFLIEMMEILSSILPLIVLIYKVVLGLSVLLSTLLSIFAGLITYRLRNRLLVWSDTRHLRVPVFAFILTVMTAVLLSYHIYNGNDRYLYYELAYLWLGIGWGITYRLMSKRYITDHGIVKNILEPSQTISWTQIIDYVERSYPKFNEYTFLYQVSNPGERRVQRLTLAVPLLLDSKLKQILLYKLDRPFELASRWPVSKTALP